MHERVQAAVGKNSSQHLQAWTLFRLIYKDQFELPCILILTEEGYFVDV